jgi:hypothetical protein
MQKKKRLFSINYILYLIGKNYYYYKLINQINNYNNNYNNKLVHNQ